MSRLLKVSCIICVVCLGDCGGGDGSTRPSSTAGITLASANPPSGSTIALRVHTNGEFSAPLAMTFTVVSDKDIAAPIAEVTLGCMIGCGVRMPVETLKANQPQTLTVERVQNLPSCSLPNTIAAVHVSVNRLFSTTAATGFARDVPVSYTFVPEVPAGLPYPFCSTTGPCLGEPGGGFTTGMCHDGAWTCSTDSQGACLSQGGLACVRCPGPLCPVLLPPPEC